MADNSKIILYAGIGVAAWWLYENWATLFPAATATPATGAGAGTPSSSSGGTTTGGGTPAGTGASAPVSPAPTAQTLAATYAALVAAATASMAGGNPAITQPSGTALFATPDVFNYFLAQVLATPPKTSPYGWPPDVTQVWPGIDRTQAMPVTQYWSGMSHYLSASLGMSGLGQVLHGLGMLVRAGRQWPEVSTEPWNGGSWPAGQGWWQGGGRAVQ